MGALLYKWNYGRLQEHPPIDGLLPGKAQFKTSAGALVEKVRSAKTRNGKVRLPGDRANEFHRQVEKDGGVEISEKVLQQLEWL